MCSSLQLPIGLLTATVPASTLLTAGRTLTWRVGHWELSDGLIRTVATSAEKVLTDLGSRFSSQPALFRYRGHFSDASDRCFVRSPAISCVEKRIQPTDTTNTGGSSNPPCPPNFLLQPSAPCCVVQREYAIWSKEYRTYAVTNENTDGTPNEGNLFGLCADNHIRPVKSEWTS